MAGQSTTAATVADKMRAAWALLYVAIVTSLTVAYLPELAVVLTGGVDPGWWIAVLIPAAVILIALVGARIAREPIKAGSEARSLVLSAAPVGLVGVCASLALAWAAGVAVIGARGGTLGSLLLVGTLLIAFAAVAEEVLLRGFLQPLLVRAWGPVAGIAFASATFAMIHVIGGWREPVSLFNIFVGGLWFGLLAWRTGGILAPSLAHVAWNWTEEILFGATPNTGVGAYGALIDVDLVGSPLWGGSPDGLNGSLILTVVLALLILPLILYRATAKTDSVGSAHKA